MSQYTNPHHPCGDLYPRPESAAGAIKRKPQFVLQGGADLSQVERAVFNVIRLTCGVTSAEIAQRTGASRQEIKEALNFLGVEGLIRVSDLKRARNSTPPRWDAVYLAA